MRQGMSFDQRGMVNRAVEKYIRAKSLADTLLADVIDERLREITYREVERAEKWLYAGESDTAIAHVTICLLYTSPSPRDGLLSRMPSSA